MSSTSTWGEYEPYPNEMYPSSLLKHLLRQMLVQFSACGGCIALLDESVGQMTVRVHMRRHYAQGVNAANSAQPQASSTRVTPGNFRPPTRRRMTTHLEHDVSPVASVQPQALPAAEEFEDVFVQQTDLLAVGSSYPSGQDLIGHAWSRNEAYVMSHEEYLKMFQSGYRLTSHIDIQPSSYLVAPIRESTVVDEAYGRHRQPAVLGVVVLYQQVSPPMPNFQPRQRAEALRYVEQIAIYLQNDRLQRSKQRTSQYLQLLQDIGTAFPTTVMLVDLVENMYRCATQVVDVSSMLITLYDRDTERIYDIFAMSNGIRVEGLPEQPIVSLKEQRPVWWRVTQEEKRSLQFSPVNDEQAIAEYDELLDGAWGNQSQTASFLLLPMKMFNRVIGSLCLSSIFANAYHPEEVQVLETMLQIVTVSIENAKLYERDRHLLYEARQREGQLAAINSTLQSINSVLNVSELLTNFVESVATLVSVDISVFFQPSPDKEELVAQAMYGRPSVSMQDDGSELPAFSTSDSKEGHDELVKMIRLPFKGTFLEQMVHEGFFHLSPQQLEELAQISDHGGNIFLYELSGRQMHMIPMHYQGELIGILAVPAPKNGHFLRPKEIGILLAICAQATNAIRNAQLFEQREEAYAELQRMDKLKDEFLVTASHELRTPLSAIIGYSSLLKRQSARISPQQTLRFATKIGGASQQLHDLIENMTVAAKMGALDKKLELNIAPVQVLSAAEIAANMLNMGMEQKIPLFVDADLWVNGDALHFRQVMTNLLDNAVKYSPPDCPVELFASETTLAQVTGFMPEDQIDHELLIEQGNMPVVLIRVTDHGEGIRFEDQRKVFDKFVRAPRSLTTPVRGSGLGLYICRRYIEAMGGKLWLEQSAPGEGSVFSFYLPQAEVPIQTGEHNTGEYEAIKDISSR
jgi:signal transduction histidine kinase